MVNSFKSTLSPQKTEACEVEECADGVPCCQEHHHVCGHDYGTFCFDFDNATLYEEELCCQIPNTDTLGMGIAPSAYKNTCR